MNSFYKTAASRYSSRAYIKDKEPLPADVIDRILAAGRAAPIGMGRFDRIHLTVVESREAIEQFRKLLLQYDKHDPLYGAPVFIAVSASDEDSPVVAALNTGAVIENMLLAATAEELGSCFIGGCLANPESSEAIHSFLQIPEGFSVYGGLVIGRNGDMREAKTLEERFAANRL